jgi:hypothetical protein
MRRPVWNLPAWFASSGAISTRCRRPPERCWPSAEADSFMSHGNQINSLRSATGWRCGGGIPRPGPICMPFCPTHQVLPPGSGHGGDRADCRRQRGHGDSGGRTGSQLQPPTDPAFFGRREREWATAVIVLNKSDACAEPEIMSRYVEGLVPGVPVIVTSAKTRRGLKALTAAYARPGQTLVFIGSSG